ncbi:TrbI/VirB10 family protein [Lysobacter hankyongensis]|uniref:TrbI/VirB10 family protein n=1 Tax=Lysobacter hankyongensis TaxID=1176535 RepID=A0ABP9CFU1_9GAMM
MNQNFPPNPPGQSGDYSSGDPQGQGYDPNAQGSNPYYAAQQQPSQQPNLDAGAPQLKSVESQKMNRKALMFLAGIVGLLILMTLIVIKNASSDKDEDVKKPKEEKVVIPDLPKGAGQPGGPDFADVQPEPQPVPVQELPPLPPEEPARQADNRRPERDEYRDAGPPEPQGPTLAERRMGMTDSGRGGYGGATAGGQANDPVLNAMLGNLQSAQQQAAGGPPQAAAQARDGGNKVSIAQYLRNPDTLLVRGTYIRCVLETRIITDVDGFTSCIVTEPVYSINGRRLLLPKGSKALGRYQGEPKGPRVAVVWDRITTPTGLDVVLEGPGVDNLGGAGHPGDYNAHWFSRMSSALMISLISDAFKYYAAEEGPQTDSVTTGGNIVTQPFESNTAKTMERLANQALNKAMSRPATVTINQGTVLNIYVAQDVDFSGVIARR